MLAIEATGITKLYNGQKAIDNVSFAVNKNELFGFIGPDGAGKSTIFRILTSLIVPTKGKATVLGLDCVTDYRELRKILGYMPGRFSLYQDLTVAENLTFFATIFGTTIEENYDLVKDIYAHIEPFKNRLAGQLSGGMKQKLALSCALIHKPEVLILDEPTTGVDAVSRKEFWQMLKKLQETDITIIVSTPYMDEASLCDRVALIQNGQIMAVNTPAEITAQFNDTLYSVRATQLYSLKLALEQLQMCTSAHLFGQDIHCTFKAGFSVDDIKNTLGTMGYSDVHIQKTDPVIEDCFIKLMSEHSGSTSIQR